MILYFSGASNDLIENKLLEFGCSRLFSQLNDRKKILKYIAMGGKDIMLDSGAFSAFNSNKYVDIDDLIEFANSITDYCKFIVNLDVIEGNPEDSYNNFIYIRKRLKEPNKLMPVFHYGEPISWLYTYLNYEDEFGKCECIGLGGIATGSAKNRRKLFDLCDPILRNYPNKWVHIFGVADITILNNYPWVTSADTTSWMMSGVWTDIVIPRTLTTFHLGNGLTKESIKRGHTPMALLNGDGVDPLITKYLNILNLTWEDLHNSRDARTLYNAYAYSEWVKNYSVPEKVINRKFIHKLIGEPKC